jgi:hypothetical protein
MTHFAMSKKRNVQNGFRKYFFILKARKLRSNMHIQILIQLGNYIQENQSCRKKRESIKFPKID